MNTLLSRVCQVLVIGSLVGWAWVGRAEVPPAAVPGKGEGYEECLVRANQLLREGALDEALAATREAQRLDPTRYEADATAAVILHAAGRSAEARASLDRALERVPEDQRAKVENIQRLIPDRPVAAQEPAPTPTLTGTARRQLDVLMLIIEEADKAQSESERKKLLQEFLEKSEPFVKENPDHLAVWTLRAMAALDLNLVRVGRDAAQEMTRLGADGLEDTRVRRILAMIDRKGWLRGPDQATAELPFVNSLGMRFVPVPNTKVLFSVWETRKSDYARFANDNPDADMSWKEVGLEGVVERVAASYRKNGGTEQGTLLRYGSIPVSGSDDHPVVRVSWEDAKAFCGWLTTKEREQGSLDAHYEYRLPTDLEWSEAVGLPAEAGDTPRERTGKVKHIYPWGTIWPPPKGAGNYMDTSVTNSFPDWPFIEGYEDGFATTSPVGSFPANKLGIYDLGGNVWEWCEDKFSPDSDNRTLRGAAFNVSNRYILMATSRLYLDPKDRGGFPAGFRVVLAPATVKPENRQRAGDEANSAAYKDGP